MNVLGLVYAGFMSMVVLIFGTLTFVAWRSIRYSDAVKFDILYCVHFLFSLCVIFLVVTLWLLVIPSGHTEALKYLYQSNDTYKVFLGLFPGVVPLPYILPAAIITLKWDTARDHEIKIKIKF